MFCCYASGYWETHCCLYCVYFKPAVELLLIDFFILSFKYLCLFHFTCSKLRFLYFLFCLKWTLGNQLKGKGMAKGEPLVVVEKVKQLRVTLQMRCKTSLNSHLCSMLQVHPRSPIEQVWALMIIFHGDLACCFYVYFSIHAAKGSIFNHKDNQLLTGNR